MAEAVAGERPAEAQRYFCHICNVEINIVPNTDFICPLCAGGFVEELPATPQATGSNTSVEAGSNTLNSSTSNNSRLTDVEALRAEIATFLMSRNGPNVEISIDPGNRRGNVITIGGGNSGNGIRSNTGGGRVRGQNLDRLDNVLIDFLHSISGGEGLGFGNSPMFFMGNPGDYAWGREGIDTIVTQLLNQMETSGPPPLPKDKIAEIPKHEVTDEEVERKLQCSVCWEDFRLKETVRKLPCSHLYHENCIVPWLDLHGTCPICRKSLAGNETNEDTEMFELNNEVENLNSTNNLDCPMHGTTSSNVPTGSRTGNNSTGSSAINATNTQTGGATSQTQPNNVFTFENDNEDLD